jgi:hypothetical protein
MRCTVFLSKAAGLLCEQCGWLAILSTRTTEAVIGSRGAAKMARFDIGDVVHVEMPKGFNKRGVHGVNVMYQTAIEARFEGATGTITDINPRGTHGIPLFLVDFATHDNSRAGLPSQQFWFRELWLD